MPVTKFTMRCYWSFVVLLVLVPGMESTCQPFRPKGCDCSTIGQYPVHYFVMCQRSELSEMPDSISYSFDETSTAQVTGNFSFNTIESIEDFYFTNSEYYTSLDFSSNRISEVGANTFSGLTKLKSLNLSQNAISSIPIGVWNDLDRLQTVDLSGNHIRTPCKLILGYITDMSFAHNSITQLEDQCFQTGAEITKLDLSYNKINYIHPAAFVMDKLVDLNLDYNSISDIGDGFQGLKTIKKLSMRGNGMRSLASICKYEWTDLTTLDLGFNELAEVDQYCFDRTGPAVTVIGTLNLENNRILRIDAQSFSGLQVTVLKLNNNSIAIINVQSVQNLNVLTHLYLNDNRLQDLLFLKDWSDNKLEELDLSENQLVNLPDAAYFNHLDTLKKLSLRGNRLFNIENNVFSAMTSLTDLSLANNRITNIAFNAFAGLQNLVRLNIAGNSMVTLRNCTFNHLTKLAEFHFEDNLSYCDCQLYWLLDFMKAVGKRSINSDISKPVLEDRCYYPKSLRDNERGQVMANKLSTSCSQTKDTACLIQSVEIETLPGASDGNVTWSQSSVSFPDLVTYRQVDVETGEIVVEGQLINFFSPAVLKRLNKGTVYQVCVTLKHQELSDTACIIWPREIVKPTPPPATDSPNKGRGMSPGDGAAVALAVILIILIVIIVLFGVYLWKTGKHRLVIPDRFQRVEQPVEEQPYLSKLEHTSNGDEGVNGKPDRLDFRPAAEANTTDEADPMISASVHSVHSYLEDDL